MADDIKSLAARIKSLEDKLNKPDAEYSEVKRNVSYIKDILDTQNGLVQFREDANKRMDHLGESIKAVRERVTKIEND